MKSEIRTVSSVILKGVMAVAILAIFGASAEAQAPRPERPYRGLFRGGVGEAEQLLTVSVSMGGGYDTNVLYDNTLGVGFVGPVQGLDSAYGGLGASLNYSFSTARTSVGASYGANGRYYENLEKQLVYSQGGGLGASYELTKTTRISGTVSVSSQPFVTLSQFPVVFDPALGQVPPPSLDQGVGGEQYLSFGSGASLTQNLTSRAMLSFNYDSQRSDLGGSFRAQSIGGQFSLTIAKGLAARAGLGYQDVAYATGEQFEGKTLDAGIDFNRALSISRRTKLAFGTGTSAITDRGETYYRLNAKASLLREIGRTWTAALGYDRDVQFLLAYTEPLLSDSVTLSAAGSLSRQLELYSSVSAQYGNLGFTGVGKGVETYTAIAGVTYGLTRFLAVNASYAFYGYQFEPNALPSPDLPSNVNRQTIQANLVLWAPLLHRARRQDAPR